MSFGSQLVKEMMRESNRRAREAQRIAAAQERARIKAYNQRLKEQKKADQQRYINECITRAEEMTRNLEKEYGKYDEIIHRTLAAPYFVDFNTFKEEFVENKFTFLFNEPQKEKVALKTPDLEDVPQESRLEKLFPSKKEKRLAAIKRNEDKIKECELAYQIAVAEAEEKYARAMSEYLKAREKAEISWKSYEKKRQERIEEHNADIDRWKQAYYEGDNEALTTYIESVLSAGDYTLGTIESHEVEYNPHTNRLLLNLYMRHKDEVFPEESYKYVRKDDEFKPVKMKVGTQTERTRKLFIQVAIATCLELFVNDRANRLKDIIVNIYHDNVCCVSTSVDKDTFEKYDFNTRNALPSFVGSQMRVFKQIATGVESFEKEVLNNEKQHEYYESVSQIIDYANDNKDSLIIKNSKEQLDSLIGELFEKTINSIKKIKTVDSEEWDVIGDFIARIKEEVEEVVSANNKILAYYDSPDFLKIKETCEALMSTQREFNEYIAEKVQSISQLFGTQMVRNETVNNDEYNYIRPYKKTITPFTAEVSAAVFASAENNPLEYIVKKFYPSKSLYPEQIQKLYQLVEELQTLSEAKQIIENYKKDYQQYLGDVPAFIMENDEAGFYARLGFATIDESVLAVEYKFSYTSGGGMAQRSFSVPMTEEMIANLIDVLKSKLTASAFAKEQRSLMTRKLRDYIKTRDNFTCCTCGNSTNMEPNLLLEIDHIIPVSKGGCTVEDNLQTLCWKCNRAKSNKIMA